MDHQARETAMILSEFDAKFGGKLAARQETFRKIVGFLAERDHPPLIVETGTARQFGNWAGDGQSTLIWNWLCKMLPGGYFRSVDLDPKACAQAISQVWPDGNGTVVCMDSVRYLETLAQSYVLENLDLLYLDSFDLNPEDPLPSAMHHLMELTACWAMLPSGCLVVVDDRISTECGKHILVERFMNQLGIKPVLTGYQIGWLKP